MKSCSIALLSSLLCFYTARVACVYDKGVSKIDRNSPTHDDEFFTFVTRPDIDAPRWNISIYNEKALSPGYWLMATYEYVEQTQDDNRAWIGPYIYDQRGDLVWSGAPAFEGYNIKDFRISNVNGQNMLTGIYTMGGFGVVVNSSYQIHDLVQVESGNSINIHDFHTVDNGRAYLTMTLKSTFASKDVLSSIACTGYSELQHPGFEERDSTTMQLRFAWNAEDRIGINETYLQPTCNGVWDHLHANSVDKFPTGDYLLCGRHTDTLYKVSGQDGSIMWRFGGKYSDFAFQGHFSGQHDARIVSHNETHTVISILDNAIRPGSPPTNDQSRGMLISLHTDGMVAEVIRVFNHPHGGYAEGRGNFQLMENGNAFLTWWLGCLISEHAPDGTLLMDASWRPPLKSYRSYKFDWVGRPVEPPDVVARSAWIKGRIQTTVYVSWNGATEVDSWVLYKRDGQSKERLASFKRTSFETVFVYDGFEREITVEGIDMTGGKLGESLTVSVATPKSTRWTYGLQQPGLSHTDALTVASLIVVCFLAVAVVRFVRTAKRLKFVWGQHGSKWQEEQRFMGTKLM